MPKLYPKGIAGADETIDRGGRKSGAAMHVDLLMRGDLVRGSEVQQMPGTSTFWKISHIFREDIPRFRQLAVEEKGALARNISPAVLRRPIDR